MTIFLAGNSECPLGPKLPISWSAEKEIIEGNSCGQMTLLLCKPTIYT